MKISSLDQVRIGQTLSIGCDPVCIVCKVGAILIRDNAYGLKLRIIPLRASSPEVLSEFTEPANCRDDSLCSICSIYQCRIYWLTPEDIEEGVFAMGR